MRQFFGKTSDGKDTNLFILQNLRGTRAEITDYGATLVRFILKDKKGIDRDLVLGYDDASGYERGDCFFGSTVGRVANRIGKGRFVMNGKTRFLHFTIGQSITAILKRCLSTV